MENEFSEKIRNELDQASENDFEPFVFLNENMWKKIKKIKADMKVLKSSY